jgi:cytoskeletal protein CcmA (bactofilin family)
MFFNRSKRRTNRIDSLIGVNARLEGDVSFSGGLRIDGLVRGNVCSTDEHPSALVLSERARIEGEVHVSHCVINGTVLGPVFASDFLELQASARVTGDVHYAVLEMHTGAVVQGRLIHQASSGKKLRLAATH